MSTEVFPCILFCCFLPLFFIEIVCGFQYKDEISCDPQTIRIPISAWFVVKGFSYLSSFFIILFYCFQDQKERKLTILLVLSQLFNFVWLILGSIILWHDCYDDIGSQPAQTLMLFSIIFGFGMLLSLIGMVNTQKNKVMPLLSENM